MAEWQTALDLLAQLRAGAVAKGGEPLLADTVSFNATINALGRGGEWEKALALLREMSKAGGDVAVSDERKRPTSLAFARLPPRYFRLVFVAPLYLHSSPWLWGMS